MTDGHLTFQEIEEYVAKRLSSELIPAFHKHVESCHSCRFMLVAMATANASGAEEHLSETEAVDFVAGLLPSEKVKVLSRHLKACSSCSSTVNDLEEFKRSNASPVRPWRRNARMLSIAATLFVMTGMSAWFAMRLRHPIQTTAELRDSGGILRLDKSGTLITTTGFSPEMTEILSKALRTGRLPNGPSDYHSDVRGVLRGSNDEISTSVLKILSPKGVRVESEKPEFRWTGADSSSVFQVTVVDEELHEVARSEWLHQNSWTPDISLPRGRSLIWQVATLVHGVRTIAPSPPEPSPRFEVIPEVDAEHIQAARARTPPSHLLLAALYAEAGLRAEAKTEIEAIASLNPDSSLAASLRDSLSTLSQ